MSTRQEVMERMAAAAGRHPTGVLCIALEALERKTRRDEAENMTRTVILEVLCERHPEADEAFDEWAARDDTVPPHGAVAVIVAAARKAAAGAK